MHVTWARPHDSLIAQNLAVEGIPAAFHSLDGTECELIEGNCCSRPDGLTFPDRKSVV